MIVSPSVCEERSSIFAAVAALLFSRAWGSWPARCWLTRSTQLSTSWPPHGALPHSCSTQLRAFSHCSTAAALSRSARRRPNLPALRASCCACVAFSRSAATSAPSRWACSVSVRGLRCAPHVRRPGRALLPVRVAAARRPAARAAGRTGRRYPPPVGSILQAGWPVLHFLSRRVFGTMNILR